MCVVVVVFRQVGEGGGSTWTRVWNGLEFTRPGLFPRANRGLEDWSREKSVSRHQACDNKHTLT